MKKHSLSVFIALALMSATAQADLVLDEGSTAPAPYAQGHGPADHNTRAPYLADGVNSGGANSVSVNGVNANGLPRLNIASPVRALPQTTAQVVRLSSVTQSGQSATPIMRAGWANNMPASLALRQIIPAQFEVKTNGVPLNFEASWAGDKPWPEVLNELAQKGGFVSHIDWNRSEVSLAPATRVSSIQSVKPAPASVVRVIETAPSVTTETTSTVTTPHSNRVFVTNEPQVVSRRVETVETRAIETRTTEVKPATREVKLITNAHSKDDVSAARIVRATETQVGIQSNVWVLDPKLTLRENIEVWAQRVGWRVVWQGADYPIIAPATFTGDFTAPNGPVAQIIAAYETSDQPLLASLTTMDRVLQVRNKNYEPQEVTPTSAGEMSPDLFQH